MNNLKAYANNFEEGENITITTDFIDTLKSACEDLEILEILKKHLVEAEKRVKGCTNSKKTFEVIIYEDDEDFEKLKELLK